jgi:hypothetical protein
LTITLTPYVKFYYGHSTLLVFTIIALVPAFFGEFILAAVLLAATVGVILAQVNNQRVEYLRKLRISEEKVRGYEYKLHGATNVHFEADKGLVE